MVALPGHGPLSAARAGRHAPPARSGSRCQTTRVSASRSCRARPRSRSADAASPLAISHGPPVNTPAGTSSRTRPPASVPSPAAHDRPHRPRTQQPPTRAAPVRPLSSRSHFATPPAHASCAPAVSRNPPHPKNRVARTIDSDGRAQQDAVTSPTRSPSGRDAQRTRRQEQNPSRGGANSANERAPP
jgi:hypothetical protein